MGLITRTSVVNAALRSLGEAPVTSADSSHPSALIAAAVLDDMLLEVLAENYWFNRDHELTLVPDGSGHIVLPANTLSADPVDVNSTLVQRGEKLYDPVNSTYVIGQSVTIKYRAFIPLEELPTIAAQYVQAKTVHRVFLDEDGDALKLQRYEAHIAQLAVQLQKEHLRNSDVNSNNALIAQKVRSRFTRRRY